MGSESFGDEACYSRSNTTDEHAALTDSQSGTVSTPPPTPGHQAPKFSFQGTDKGFFPKVFPNGCKAQWENRECVAELNKGSEVVEEACPPDQPKFNIFNGSNKLDFYGDTVSVSLGGSKTLKIQFDTITKLGKSLAMLKNGDILEKKWTVFDKHMAAGKPINAATILGWGTLRTSKGTDPSINWWDYISVEDVDKNGKSELICLGEYRFDPKLPKVKRKTGEKTQEMLVTLTESFVYRHKETLSEIAKQSKEPDWEGEVLELLAGKKKVGGSTTVCETIARRYGILQRMLLKCKEEKDGVDHHNDDDVGEPSLEPEVQEFLDNLHDLSDGQKLEILFSCGLLDDKHQALVASKIKEQTLKKANQCGGDSNSLADFTGKLNSRLEALEKAREFVERRNLADNDMSLQEFLEHSVAMQMLEDTLSCNGSVAVLETRFAEVEDLLNKSGEGITKNALKKVMEYKTQTDEVRKEINEEIKDGFDPNFMQLLTPVLLNNKTSHDKRGIINLGKTGCGKSAAAIISAYYLARKGPLTTNTDARSPIVLIICPSQLTEQWQNNTRDLFPDVFDVVLEMGDGRTKRWQPCDPAKIKLIVCSLSLLSNDEKFEDLKRLVKQASEQKELALLVLDECQKVKRKDGTAASKRAINADTLVKVCFEKNPHCRFLPMTATPIINEAQEGHSLVKLVYPGVADLPKSSERKLDTWIAMHRELKKHGLRVSSRRPIPYKLYLPSSDDDGDKVFDHLMVDENGTVEYDSDQRIEFLPIEELVLLTEGSKSGSKRLAYQSAFTKLRRAKRIADIIVVDKSPTVIYTHYVGSTSTEMTIVSELQDAIKQKWGDARIEIAIESAAGSKSREKIIKCLAEIDVLIIGRGFAVGIDGLQDRFSRLIYNTLPCTAEMWEQANGRLVREGQKETVKIYVVAVTVEHASIDYDDRCDWRNLKYKRMVMDACVDGKFPVEPKEFQDFLKTRYSKGKNLSWEYSADSQEEIDAINGDESEETIAESGFIELDSPVEGDGSGSGSGSGVAAGSEKDGSNIISNDSEGPNKTWFTGEEDFGSIFQAVVASEQDLPDEENGRSHSNQDNAWNYLLERDSSGDSELKRIIIKNKEEIFKEILTPKTMLSLTGASLLFVHAMNNDLFWKRVRAIDIEELMTSKGYQEKPCDPCSPILQIGVAGFLSTDSKNYNIKEPLHIFDGICKYEEKASFETRFCSHPYLKDSNGKIIARVNDCTSSVSEYKALVAIHSIQQHAKDKVFLTFSTNSCDERWLAQVAVGTSLMKTDMLSTVNIWPLFRRVMNAASKFLPDSSSGKLLPANLNFLYNVFVKEAQQSHTAAEDAEWLCKIFEELTDIMKPCINPRLHLHEYIKACLLSSSQQLKDSVELILALQGDVIPNLSIHRQAARLVAEMKGQGMSQLVKLIGEASSSGETSMAPAPSDRLQTEVRVEVVTPPGHSIIPKPLDLTGGMSLNLNTDPPRDPARSKKELFPAGKPQ